MQIAGETFEVIKSNVLQGSKVILDVEEQGLDERTILALDAATKISSSGSTCFHSSDGKDHCFAEAQPGDCSSFADPDGRRQLWSVFDKAVKLTAAAAAAAASAAALCFPGRDALRSAVKSYISQNCDTTNTSCATRTQYGEIGTWCVARILDMNRMFYLKSSFNSDISKWNVFRVTNMEDMFGGASSFNQNISSWNVGIVTNMRGMFNYASSFNSDISKWDVKSVTDMGGMFAYAPRFNSDISNWDIRRVTDMMYMFRNASSFNQNLCAWGPKRPSSIFCPGVMANLIFVPIVVVTIPDLCLKILVAPMRGVLHVMDPFVL